MRLLGEVFRRLRAVVLRRRLERDLDDEIAFHLAMREEEQRVAGLPADEAATAARRRFGNPALLKEQTRDAWLFPFLEASSQDIRFAIRSLIRAPGFTLVAVLTLALGIGLTTAMFTLMDALIIRPVPFDHPDDLAMVYMGGPTGGRVTVAPAVLRAWRESPGFAGAEAAVPQTALIEISDIVAARGLARVTPGIFDLLGGVRPLRGRLFDATDGRAGTNDRVLLSEDVWRTLYHSDASIIGQRVVIDRETLLVVGILPREFRFPRWDTVIWRAMDFAAPATQISNFPIAYVRFASAVPREEALRMATDAARGADARNAKLLPKVRPLAGEVLDRYYQRALPLLAGGVLLVFLVLCANVSSLMLARLTERGREFSMRSALGASRGRVVRQAFVETVVMSAVGLVAGTAAAWALVSMARVFLPESLLLRTLNPLNLDMRSLGIASLAGVTALLSAGTLPAWIGTRANPIHSLHLLERSGTETRSTRTLTRSLLVAEISLACTLLVGATLLVRSFINLSKVDRGLKSEGVMTAWISLDRPMSRDPAARLLILRSVEEHVRQLPGIDKLAWSIGKPPSGGFIHSGDWKSDLPEAQPVDMHVEGYSVSPDFFALYQIPLLDGRTFQASDTKQDVLVGERLARTLWPGMNPVGHNFTFENQLFNVIGVVTEIRHPSLDPHVDMPEFYTKLSGDEELGSLSIRCRSTCPDVALLRREVRNAHPDVRVLEANVLDEVYFEQLAQPRAAAVFGFTFATVAVLAAAAGLFSVLTYSVGRRKREYGIRSALGASAGQIRRLVLEDSVVVAVCGLTLGTSAAWLLARTLESFQFGVSVNDPFSWLFVVAVIGVVTLAASWRPAELAVRADPVVLLKDE
jgi:predicted permease